MRKDRTRKIEDLLLALLQQLLLLNLIFRFLISTFDKMLLINFRTSWFIIIKMLCFDRVDFAFLTAYLW